MHSLDETTSLDLTFVNQKIFGTTGAFDKFVVTVAVINGGNPIQYKYVFWDTSF